MSVLSIVCWLRPNGGLRRLPQFLKLGDFMFVLVRFRLPDWVSERIKCRWSSCLLRLILRVMLTTISAGISWQL